MIAEVLENIRDRLKMVPMRAQIIQVLQGQPGDRSYESFKLLRILVL